MSKTPGKSGQGRNSPLHSKNKTQEAHYEHEKNSLSSLLQLQYYLYRVTGMPLITGKYKKDKVEAGDPIGMTVFDEIHVEYWVGGYHKGDAVNPSPLLILNGSDLDFRCLRKK